MTLKEDKGALLLFTISAYFASLRLEMRKPQIAQRKTLRSLWFGFENNCYSVRGKWPLTKMKPAPVRKAIMAKANPIIERSAVMVPPHFQVKRP